METNGTDYNSYDEAWLPFIVCQSISAIFAFFGNGLIITTFLYDKKLRSRQHFHLFSLASADCFNSIFGAGFSVQYHLHYPKNRIACLICMGLSNTFSVISVYNKVNVSINRYWASVHPFSYFKKHKLIYTKGK